MKVISDAKLQQAIGWSPHINQQKILDSNSRDKAICAGRGFGKSAVCAYIALKSLIASDNLIVIIAPTYDLAQRVFDYLQQWIAKAFPDLIPGVSSRIPQKIKTPWGSLLECKSADSPVGILGKRYNLVIVDEASRIPRNVWETYVYPTTSTGGKSLFISTPFGKNWFYEKWLDTKKTDGAFHFTTKDNPTLLKGAYEWERAKEKLPEQVFKQEYRALFLDDAAAVFRGVRDIIEDCLSDIVKDHFYIVGWDIAQFHDFSVITVIDSQTKKVVYFDRFKHIEYPFQKKRVIATVKRYNNARLVVDSTGVGQPIKEDLERDGLFVDDFHFTGKSKKELIEKLSIFIEQRHIRIPDNSILIDELEAFGYQLTDAGNIRYSAPTGLYDDCVISLALAVWGLYPGKPQQKNYLKKRLKEFQKSRKPIKSFI